MRQKPDMTLLASNLLVRGGRLRLYRIGFNRRVVNYLKNNL